VSGQQTRFPTASSTLGADAQAHSSSDPSPTCGNELTGTLRGDGSTVRNPAFEYDVVHTNSEFPDQVSDHEPQVVRLDLRGH
jgi:hypothetical protein